MLTKQQQEYLENSGALKAVLSLASDYRCNGKVDVIKMIKNDPLGINVGEFVPKTQQENNVDAYVYISADKKIKEIKYKKGTEINNGHLFHCFHEYLHKLFEFEDGQELLRFRPSPGVMVRTEFEEKLDYLTAATLLEKDLFKKDFNDAKDTKTEDDFISEMCKKYGVVPACVKNRMEELNLRFA